MSNVDDVIKHYGVKGMRWGIRKRSGGSSSSDTSSPSEPKSVGKAVKVEIGPGKRIKTTGGQKQLPSADAINAAVAKQKAKKSGVKSLTNKEMQDLIGRMNLEQSYSKLAKKEREANRSFTRKFLETQGKQFLMKELKNNGKNVTAIAKAAKDFDVDLSKIKISSLV